MMGRSALHQRSTGSKNKLPAKQAENWTLDRWVGHFHNVYGDVNKDVPPTILWLNAVDEATKLSEWVRREKPLEALRQVIRLFAWICGFIGKYLEQEEFKNDDPIKGLLRKKKVGADFNQEFLEQEESYLKWVLWKYPRVCAVCGGRPCECGTRRSLVEARKAKSWYDKRFKEKEIEWARRLKKKKKELNKKKFREYTEKSLDELIDVFIDIYGGGHQDLKLWDITAHLLEEVGEVARGILVLERLKEGEINRMDTKDLAEVLRSCRDKYIDKKIRENARTNAEYKDRLFRVLEEDIIEPNYGLPQALLQKFSKKEIKSDPVGAAEVLRDWAVEDLKGELADTFSWVSAFLHKIGEGKRAYAYREEDKDKWCQFADDLVNHCKDKAENLVCPSCAKRRCSKSCLFTDLLWTILHEKGERELREELARREISK